MDVPGGVGSTGGSEAIGWLRRPDEWTVFIPRVLAGGGWVRVGTPQRDPRMACLVAAARMRLLRPGMAQGDALSRAECAARVLADGLAGTVMLDEGHRVDRVDL